MKQNDEKSSVKIKKTFRKNDGREFYSKSKKRKLIWRKSIGLYIEKRKSKIKDLTITNSQSSDLSPLSLNLKSFDHHDSKLIDAELDTNYTNCFNQFNCDEDKVSTVADSELDTEIIELNESTQDDLTTNLTWKIKINENILKVESSKAKIDFESLLNYGLNKSQLIDLLEEDIKRLRESLIYYESN